MSISDHETFRAYQICKEREIDVIRTESSGRKEEILRLRAALFDIYKLEVEDIETLKRMAKNALKVCGIEIPGDGTEWADWTEICEECEADEQAEFGDDYSDQWA